MNNKIAKPDSYRKALRWERKFYISLESVSQIKKNCTTNSEYVINISIEYQAN